jgi:hypothetical protein
VFLIRLTRGLRLATPPPAFPWMIGMVTDEFLVFLGQRLESFWRRNRGSSRRQ